MPRGFYCATCNNTGSIDCHCGGDLCVCGDEEIPCPDCVEDDDFNEGDVLQTPA